MNKRGLERRVVENVEHGGHRAKGRASAQKHRDQAKMADTSKRPEAL